MAPVFCVAHKALPRLDLVGAQSARRLVALLAVQHVVALVVLAVEIDPALATFRTRLAQSVSPSKKPQAALPPRGSERARQ
jgi:hypothetical protein